MPLSCRLGHRQTSTLQGFHIVVGFRQSHGLISRDMPHALPSQTSAIHFYHAPFSFFTWHPNHFSLSCPSRYQSTSSVTSSAFPYVDPLSNSVILHSLYMAEPSENTFINPFAHPFLHSVQLPYPCILKFIHSPDIQQTSGVVHLYSPNPRPLLLLLYHCLTTIYKNRLKKFVI